MIGSLTHRRPRNQPQVTPPRVVSAHRDACRSDVLTSLAITLFYVTVPSIPQPST